MAITSVGYAGTVDDVEWPLLTRYAGGSTYNVAGVSDFAATPGVGDRAVAVAAGVAAGAGVVDTSDAPVTLTLGSVASGSRWDLIGLERDWGLGTTSLVVVPGSASKVLPARATNPGVSDVQPLWLVRVAAGQTTVQEFVDLRVWVSDGGAVAQDDLVRSYLTRVGTELVIGSSRWSRRIGSTGSAEWVQGGGEGLLAPLSPQGWTVTGDVETATVGAKKRVTLSLVVAKSGAAVSVPSNAYRSVGVVLPEAARFGSGDRYVPVSIWNDATWTAGTAYLNMGTGSLSVRAIGSSLTVGGFFEVHCVVYGT